MTLPSRVVARQKAKDRWPSESKGMKWCEVWVPWHEAGEGLSVGQQAYFTLAHSPVPSSPLLPCTDTLSRRCVTLSDMPAAPEGPSTHAYAPWQL